MDLTKQLQAYEVEYQVLNDELHAPSDQRAAHLERIYQSLQQQNSELLEELQVKKINKKTQKLRSLEIGSGYVLFGSISSSAQVSHVRVSSLEQQLESLVQSESLLKEQVSTLELEKSQLVDTVVRLQQILAKLSIQTSSDGPALPSTSERCNLAAEGEGGEDDSGLSSPLSDVFPTHSRNRAAASLERLDTFIPFPPRKKFL